MARSTQFVATIVSFVFVAISTVPAASRIYNVFNKRSNFEELPSEHPTSGTTDLYQDNDGLAVKGKEGLVTNKYRLAIITLLALLGFVGCLGHTVFHTVKPNPPRVIEHWLQVAIWVCLVLAPSLLWY